VRFLDFELEGKGVCTQLYYCRTDAQICSVLSCCESIVTWPRESLLERGAVSFIQLERDTGDM